MSEPVVFDTGFGAATGAVPFNAAYLPVFPPGSFAAVTVPSSATVVGETPAANNPSSGVVRTTGSEVVAAQSIPNFTITETGESLGIDLPLDHRQPAAQLRAPGAREQQPGRRHSDGTYR